MYFFYGITLPFITGLFLWVHIFLIFICFLTSNSKAMREDPSKLSLLAHYLSFFVCRFSPSWLWELEWMMSFFWLMPSVRLDRTRGSHSRWGKHQQVLPLISYLFHGGMCESLSVPVMYHHNSCATQSAHLFKYWFIVKKHTLCCFFVIF